MNVRPQLLLATFLLVHLAAASCLTSLSSVPRTGEILVVAISIVQVNLIALWGALSQGTVVRRLPWIVLLGTLMWCAIVAGSFWFDEYGPMQRSDALLLGIVLGMVLLSTFTMLWLICPWLRWRLTFSTQDVAASERFSTREIFIGTTLMCIALALARWMLPPGVGTMESDMEFSLILALAAGLNLIATLPLVWIAFGSPRVLIIGLLIGAPAYSILFAGVEANVLMIFLRRLPPESELFLDLWVLNALQLWLLAGSLLVLRWAGFQLVRIERLGKAAEPGRR